LYWISLFGIFEAPLLIMRARLRLAAKKLFQHRVSRGGQSCPPRIQTSLCAAGKTARRAIMKDNGNGATYAPLPFLFPSNRKSKI
jgi:hypothetical protein